MPNYVALKNEIALPAYNGMTDAQIVAALNVKIVAAPQKVLLAPSTIINAIVPADLAGLTPAQVSFLTLVLQGSVVDASSGTTVRIAIQTIFSGKATTLSQLGALVAPYDNATTLWLSVNFGSGFVQVQDLALARAS